MAKPTRKKVRPKKKTPARKKKSAKKSSRRKTAPRAKAQRIRDARVVVQERRFEARTLVTHTTFAAVAFKAGEVPETGLIPDISALVIDTSVGGCNLVFMRSNPVSAELAVGVHCVIQMHPEGPRRAVIRWVKDLDARLRNAGFAYV